MRSWPVIALSFLLAAGVAHGGGMAFLDYHRGTGYLPQTPSVTGGGAAAFANPAAWAATDEGMIDFWWNDRSVRDDQLDNWGFSLGRELGFAMQRSVLPGEEGSFRVDDYQIGFAGGDRRGFAGVAWRWSGGESGRLGRENSLVTGFMKRPNRYVSYGLASTLSFQSDARLGIADIGIRPFGKSWVTLFGDYSLTDRDDLGAGRWGAGVEVRPWRGIHVGFKTREAEELSADDYDYSLNFGLTLNGTGFHVLPGYDRDGNRGVTNYLVRSRPPYAGIPVDRWLRKVFEKPRYVPVNLENKRITYQKADWFEDEKVAWLDLAEELDRIGADPAVGGVVFNLAGLSLSPSLTWELRRKMDGLRAGGKEVIVHVDRTTNLGYYLACGADRISIDPQGDLFLPGLAAHRTYMRGFLDKLGIGVEEWRHFTHKSAFEGLTRTDMSDADREQIGRAVDVIYETMREGVCETRGLTPAEFDALVDDQALFTASRALEAGLVDTLARWDGMGEWIEENREGARFGGSVPYPDGGVLYDEVWGRPKELALVYALGECAMDTGIRGRATSEQMRKLAKRDDVAAVVLRADSPGGDPLPSDLVAEATRMLREEGKPVVVSQGDVAGSGGYWISMRGSEILTTPLTITGSIGVIGGWLWDDGIGGKTGFSADGVQRGAHADLFTGIRFPLFGRLPERNLDDGEKEIVRRTMLELYDDFVRQVAESREVTEEHVRMVGEGRIWMGGDAIEKDLADEIGGLQDAIAAARRLAGVGEEEELILSEYPPRPRFRFPRMGGSPMDLFLSRLAGKLGFGEAAPPGGPVSYEEIYLRALTESPGGALLLTPPEMLPAEYSERVAR